MYFTNNDGSQNTFVYQPTLDTLELKKDKGIDYILSWKSNGVYNSKLKSLYTAFLYSITHSGHKTRIKFDNDLLAVKQKSFKKFMWLICFAVFCVYECCFHAYVLTIIFQSRVFVLFIDLFKVYCFL